MCLINSAKQVCRGKYCSFGAFFVAQGVSWLERFFSAWAPHPEKKSYAAVCGTYVAAGGVLVLDGNRRKQEVRQSKLGTQQWLTYFHGIFHFRSVRYHNPVLTIISDLWTSGDWWTVGRSEVWKTHRYRLYTFYILYQSSMFLVVWP